MKKIAFVGMGNMGKAISIPMNKKFSSYYSFAASNPSADKLEVLKNTSFILSSDNKKTCLNADYIFVCVKPDKIPSVLSEIKPSLSAHTIIISVAAGVDLLTLSKLSNHPITRIIRLMPNLAAEVQYSVTALSISENFPKAEKQELFSLLESFGSVWTLDESLMNAVPAISGSSPAYVFMMIDALADGAVRDGIPRSTALSMAALAIEGAARLYSSSSLHPIEWKDRVCSPGGTTIEAVAALEKHGFRNSILEAMAACTQKNKDLLIK